MVLQAIRHTRIAHKGGWVGKAPADEAHGVVLQAIRHTRIAHKGGWVGKAPADEAHGVVLQAIRHTHIAHKGGWLGKAFGADSKSSRPPTSVSNKGHTLQTQDVQLSHEGLSRHDCQATESQAVENTQDFHF